MREKNIMKNDFLMIDFIVKNVYKKNKIQSQVLKILHKFKFMGFSYHKEK